MAMAGCCVQQSAPPEPRGVTCGQMAEQGADEDEDDEEARQLAEAIRQSLELAAQTAKAQPGDPAILPCGPGLIELFAQAACTGQQACTGLAHLRPGGAAGAPVTRALFCSPSTVFHYYGASGEGDRGWGCAYRCAQMIISGLPQVAPVRAEAATVPPRGAPSIAQIQRALAGMAERPFTPEQVGSTAWIEPPDVAAYLRAHWGVPRVAERRVRPSQPSELDDMCAALWAHFGGGGAAAEEAAKGESITVSAPAVMIDDGMFAYCIGGICAVAAAELEPEPEPETEPETETETETEPEPETEPDPEPETEPGEAPTVAQSWCLVLDPHVARPTAGGAAPAGVSCAHFEQHGSGGGGGGELLLGAEGFGTTAPLEPVSERALSIVRTARFD
jgi:hypothetical protein